MSRTQSRRGWLQSVASLTALGLGPLVACGSEEPILVPAGYEADAALLERVYSPELIPHLQTVGAHHVSNRGTEEVHGIYEEAASILRASMDDSFAELDDRIAADFRTLRVEDVSGWTLSRTETHLAVLSLALP